MNNTEVSYAMFSMPPASRLFQTDNQATIDYEDLGPDLPATQVIWNSVRHGVNNESPEQTSERYYDEKLYAISDGIYKFSQKFYKELSNYEKENLVCSPLGAGIVLSMAAFGSRGLTGEQLKSKINMLENNKINRLGFHSLINAFRRIKRIELRLAQKVFIKEGFEIESEFKNILKTNYRSEVQTLNFENPEQASQAINSWCLEQTKDLANIVKPNDVNKASIVLINTVRLSGFWRWRFYPRHTRPYLFYPSDNTSIVVDMLYQKNWFNYGKLIDIDARYIEIPYEPASAAESISMFIIVPNKRNGLEKIEHNLDRINYKTLYENNSETEMILCLPKFKFESQFNLTPVLQSMGIKEIFTEKANFSGINKTVPLKVDKVIQKTFIEVDENGTNVLAGGHIGLRGGSSRISSRQAKLCVKYPFLFAIYHHASNTVLFQGHVKSLPPSKKPYREYKTIKNINNIKKTIISRVKVTERKIPRFNYNKYNDIYNINLGEY